MADQTGKRFVVPQASFNFVSADWDVARRNRRTAFATTLGGCLLLAAVVWAGVSTGSQADQFQVRQLELADLVVVLGERERELTGGITDLKSFADAKRIELFAVANNDLELEAAIGAILETVPPGVTIQGIELIANTSAGGEILTRYSFTATGLGTSLSDPLEWRDKSLKVPAIVTPSINFSNSSRSDVQMTLKGGLRDEVVIPRGQQLEASVGKATPATIPPNSTPESSDLPDEDNS